jgi:hypothetical protein
MEALSDSQSNQSVAEEMSSSSFADSTSSMESSNTKKNINNNGGGVKQCKPAAVSASTRSSVSSMTSTTSSCTSLHYQSNLNHALALVTNKLDREQRKHDQDATRKLTLLRQRKISAVLKVRKNLQFILFYPIQICNAPQC